MRISLILALTACALTSACEVRVRPPANIAPAAHDQVTVASTKYDGGVLLHPTDDGTSYSNVVVWKVSSSRNYADEFMTVDSDNVERHLENDRRDVYFEPDNPYGELILKQYQAARRAGKHFGFNEFGE